MSGDMRPGPGYLTSIVAGLLTLVAVVALVWAFNWNWVRGQTDGFQAGWDEAVRQCRANPANCKRADERR